MSQSEATTKYQQALKAGKRTYKNCLMSGGYPYLQILDEMLSDDMIAGRVDLGVIDVPAGQIVGAKSIGRRTAFAADFMPLLVPALALVAALGRVGCFCAGCCYGVECDSPVSVVFPAASLAAPPGVPRLPVQLFEAAVQLALFLALLWFTAGPRRARFAAEFYLACYCPARFVLEFFRGDVARGALWGLSTSQWLSAAGFLAVSLYFFMRSGRKMPD